MKDMPLQTSDQQDSPEATATDSEATSTTTIIGKLEEFPLNTMKMATVGETTIAVVRTSTGTYALDNACPHQGYGLTTGALSVDDSGNAEITCQWHNWKFRVQDGTCTIGQENVACHRVEVNDQDEISVTVTKPSSEELRDRLWPSLRSGFENDYLGQLSRDSIRLLDAGATPASILWEGVSIAAPKHDYGPGHDLAFAADCLHLAELWEGDEQALPLIQGLAGLAEGSRDRTPSPTGQALLSPGTDHPDLGERIEAEDLDGAMASVVASLAEGVDVATIRHQFIKAVSQHHLGYGHGAIYTQKAFELLDRVGWDKAIDLLPMLAKSITYSTREDTLPYMAKFMKAMARVDLDALASADDRATTRWNPEETIDQLLNADKQPLELAVAAIENGGGVEGLLDAVSLAVSKRLLRYDTEAEHLDANFGWLDITHGLTYSRAARWAWQLDPGPHTARLALFTAWLAFDTGRLERRAGVAETPEPTEAIAAALDEDPDIVGERLAREALQDRAGSFIVIAHLLKTAQAAQQEAAYTKSSLPLAAAARLIHEPRRERFVATNVAASLDFLRTGRPPKR